MPLRGGVRCAVVIQLVCPQAIVIIIHRHSFHHLRLLAACILIWGRLRNKHQDHLRRLSEFLEQTHTGDVLITGRRVA
jgi:hypothetical protein